MLWGEERWGVLWERSGGVILRIPLLLLISGKSGIRIICVAPKEAACDGVRASGSGH